MTQNIAIYVQHLLGAGHLVRAMSLAEALSDAGHQVVLLSGGFPIDLQAKGYQFFQLPPTRAIDGDFTRLVDSKNKLISQHWRAHRATLLLAELDKFKPDLVITESFPFGRRQFRFELEPLLDWVSARPHVRLIASIRDILQRRTDDKNRASVDTIQNHYDAVLVHADERLFTLDASFPLSAEIKNKLFYTGYIHQAGNVSGADKSLEGRDEIIVSGGSGTVSANLLETARLAKPLSSAKKHVWRLLTGRGMPRSIENNDPELIVEANRPDFVALLSRCALSISQAGYNTTLDVLSTGARSVMIPFAGDGETEQTDRAEALQSAGRLIQLPESELSPKRLAHAIDSALELTPVNIDVDLKGAANSATFISQKLHQWQA